MKLSSSKIIYILSVFNAKIKLLHVVNSKWRESLTWNVVVGNVRAVGGGANSDLKTGLYCSRIK